MFGVNLYLYINVIMMGQKCYIASYIPMYIKVINFDMCVVKKQYFMASTCGSPVTNCLIEKQIANYSYQLY